MKCFRFALLVIDKTKATRAARPGLIDSRGRCLHSGRIYQGRAKARRMRCDNPFSERFRTGEYGRSVFFHFHPAVADKIAGRYAACSFRTVHPDPDAGMTLPGTVQCMQCVTRSLRMKRSVILRVSRQPGKFCSRTEPIRRQNGNRAGSATQRALRGFYYLPNMYPTAMRTNGSRLRVFG